MGNPQLSHVSDIEAAGPMFSSSLIQWFQIRDGILLPDAALSYYTGVVNF
jgi:hypothetical protein